jgi:purine nucleoside permease
MALALSGQFDLSHAYWIINGIAGVDPAVASIGSAAWSRFVIDGDIAYEIDSREADPSWPYGILAIGTNAPNEKPKQEEWDPHKMAFALNPSLVAWAYAMTKDVPIPDSPEMAAYRATYVGYPNALKPPFVLLVGRWRNGPGTGPSYGPTEQAHSRWPTWRIRGSRTP